VAVAPRSARATLTPQHTARHGRQPRAKTTTSVFRKFFPADHAVSLAPKLALKVTLIIVKANVFVDTLSSNWVEVDDLRQVNGKAWMSCLNKESSR